MDETENMAHTNDQEVKKAIHDPECVYSDRSTAVAPTTDGDIEADLSGSNTAGKAGNLVQTEGLGGSGRPLQDGDLGSAADTLVEPVAAQVLNFYALSWRAKSGILHEHINFRARDEADLLEKFSQKVPRDRRTGPRGPTLGPGTRSVVDDADDSLQWVWQPVGLSLSDAARSLSQLCAVAPVTKR